VADNKRAFKFRVSVVKQVISNETLLMNQRIRN